ncbi:MAG: DUF362 domain-containing protein [Proteobacteria bacterium]|nr:DUF362 domain-containing protein [Pseudomonadota bacterium]
MMQTPLASVFLTALPRYHQPQLEEAVDGLLNAMLEPRALRTAKVVLKPNLITAKNGQLACTDSRMIVAVAQWFQAHGAQVAVGDSPSFGSARAVLAAIGALPALQRLGVPVLEFRRRQEITLACGQKAALATAALECDLLFNLPKVKAHSQMRMTLAVKNLFGCLAGFHKPWWHMAHGGNNGRFADLLVELLAVLPAGCTVVDGVTAMHRTGPIHGDPYFLGVLAGGVNPVAVDTALLALLGIDPGDCPLWHAARRAALPGTTMEELVFPLMHPAELAVHDFVVPEILASIRFEICRFVTSSIKRALLRTGVAR